MYSRMEMAKEKERKPVALFMAFGTKGDVHPIAAIAVAFACDQEQYDVIFVTHSAHEHLLMHQSAPSSFERCFKKELPLLYEYLQEAPVDKVSWKDVIHWMWPPFTEDWGSWRSDDMNLSTWPFTYLGGTGMDSAKTLLNALKSSPMHPLVSATAVFAAVFISFTLISDRQRRAKHRRWIEQMEEQKNKLIEELNQVEEQNREEKEKHLASTLDRWLQNYKEMNADFKEMNARLSSHMERFEVERSKSSPAHTSLESSSPPQDSRDLIF